MAYIILLKTKKETFIDDDKNIININDISFKIFGETRNIFKKILF